MWFGMGSTNLVNCPSFMNQDGASISVIKTCKIFYNTISVSPKHILDNHGVLDVI